MNSDGDCSDCVRGTLLVGNGESEFIPKKFVQKPKVIDLMAALEESLKKADERTERIRGALEKMDEIK